MGGGERQMEGREQSMSATPNISGGCACGAIRYETAVDPVLMLNCHCRACQSASGSAYAPLLVVPKHELRLLGELRYHRKIGDSGKSVERGFCPNCGSPIALKLERMPEMIAVHAGSLDDPKQFRPAMDLFTKSAQPWDHMSPESEKYPRGIAA
jgi:hypothetical protein